MEIDLLGIALRWLHIMAAITLFGGLIFRAVALNPASKELDDASREKLNEAIRKRWAKIVGMAALVLIGTGVWNLMLLIKEYAPIRGNTDLGYANEMLLRVPNWYTHALLTKIALAFVVFFLSSLLVGRGKLAKKVQANSGKWVCITIVLAMIIVGLSAVLRSTHTGPNVKNVMEVAVDKDPPPVFKAGEDQGSSSTTGDEAPQNATEEMQIDLPDLSAIPE